MENCDFFVFWFVKILTIFSYEHLKGGGKGGCWNGGKGELGGFCSLVNEMPWWVWSKYQYWWFLSISNDIKNMKSLSICNDSPVHVASGSTPKRVVACRHCTSELGALNFRMYLYFILEKNNKSISVKYLSFKFTKILKF